MALCGHLFSRLGSECHPSMLTALVSSAAASDLTKTLGSREALSPEKNFKLLKFDSLVRAVDQPSFLEILKTLGFRSMTVQIGRGEYKPTCQAPDFASDYYDFKSTGAAAHPSL